MVCSGDGTARTLASTDGPVLLEGSSSLNGRLVCTGGLEDLVCGTVGGDTADFGGGGGGIVGAKVFDDVVFDEGGGSPTIDGEVGVSVGFVGSGVGDGALREELV